MTGLTVLLNGAEIRSNTFAQGDAGRVEVSAGGLRIDRGDSSNPFTGISSDANSDSSGQAGTVRVTVTGLAELLNGAAIRSNTFAQGDAGSVEVSAGELRIDRRGSSNLFTGISSSASSGSSGQAGTVRVTVTGLTVLLNGAEIRSSTFSQGDAGSVEVSAVDLRINRAGRANPFTGISSSANPGSSGRAGTVRVTVTGLAELLNGAVIRSSTFAQGDAGRVEVSAGELRIDGRGSSNLFTGINSSAEPDSLGQAGTVRVMVMGLAELLSGAAISSSAFAQGNAGRVEVSAGELRIDGRGLSNPFTGISSSANLNSSGQAGTVRVTVTGLAELLNGAEVRSSTFAQGDAGSVEVSAGELRIDRGRTSNPFTGIASLATRNATGLVGNVEVMAGTVTLLNGGTISIEAAQVLPESQITEQIETRILIRADHLHLDGEATITAESTGNVPASAIELRLGMLLMEDNSRISTESSDVARGGDIQVTAQSIVRLRESTITAEVSLADGSGVGGNIDIEAAKIELTGDAHITTESGGEGNAGGIRLDAQQTLLIDQSEVSTSATQADGGDVNIATDFIQLRDGRIVTAVGSGEGQGGNITVDTNLGLLERSEIRADAFGGPGGNITIRSNGFISDVNSAITASSQQSVDGMVDIQGLDDLSGSLTDIDPGFAATAALRSDPCIGRLRGEGISRFTVAGRDRLPSEPGGLLPSPAGQLSVSAAGQPAEQQAAQLSLGRLGLAPARTAWHRDCGR